MPQKMGDFVTLDPNDFLDKNGTIVLGFLMKSDFIWIAHPPLAYRDIGQYVKVKLAKFIYHVKKLLLIYK